MTRLSVKAALSTTVNMERFSLLKVFILVVTAYAVNGGHGKPPKTPAGKNECVGAKRELTECGGGRGICWYHDNKPGVNGHLVCKGHCDEEPPSMTNAQVTGIVDFNTTFEGATFTYVCDDDYAARPGSCMTTTCTSHGNWTEAGFECVPYCGSLNASTLFDHGTVTQSSGQLEGDVAVIDCEHPYSANISLFAYCNEAGDWTKSQGECKELSVETNSVNCCPDYWIYINGSCYLFAYGEWMSAHAAEDYCEERGGFLVHVDNSEENEKLKEIMRDYKNPEFGYVAFWMGLNDENIEGTYVWRDTNTISQFFDFNPSQPNGVDWFNCVAFVSFGEFTWFDGPCSVSGAAPLCEMR